MELADVARAALVLQCWTSYNEGFVDFALFDAPHLQEVFDCAVPRRQLETLIENFTTTVAGARALNAVVPPVAPHRQRFAFNSFVAKPLLDLGTGGVWAPQSVLVTRAVFPGNLYYAGIKEWGSTFAETLGARVERYVGRQLELVAGDHVTGEIEHRRGQKSVDWIWITDAAVVLIECKSARLTLGAKTADPTLSSVVSRSLGEAREQIDRTASPINDRHQAFSHVPADRPVIGLIVTAEPFYLGNATNLPEYGEPGTTPTQVISLRELEHLVCFNETEAVELLRSVLADPEKRTWSMSTAMRGLRAVPRNPILEVAWKQFDYLDMEALKEHRRRNRGES